MPSDMQELDIQEEAIRRQGTTLKIQGKPYLIEGDKYGASFSQGAEGLVHLAIQSGKTPSKRRIKVFWNPDDVRYQRSLNLVKQNLADETKAIDVLGGAPYAMLESMGGVSRFALVMKNVEGKSFKNLCQSGAIASTYPPGDWPALKIRLLWAYGLALAVEQMEARGFVHADISDGNVVVEATGNHPGAMALVDFDAYYYPDYPSGYRGTDGFVAPEIFLAGSIGVGSDRVAMAILIQEFLLAGDSDLDRQEAFADPRYTQDDLCRFQVQAHPLLKKKYPHVERLFDQTVRQPDRAARPVPEQWRIALRSVYREHFGRAVHLSSSEGANNIRLSFGEGESQSLLATPFAIHADLAPTASDGWQLRPHAGAAVQIQRSGESWQGVDPARGALLTNNTLLHDPKGRFTARIRFESRRETVADAPGTLTLSSFHESVQPAQRSGWNELIEWLGDHPIWIGLLAALALLLALLFLAHPVWVFHSEQGNVPHPPLRDESAVPPSAAVPPLVTPTVPQPVPVPKEANPPATDATASNTVPNTVTTPPTPAIPDAPAKVVRRKQPRVFVVPSEQAGLNPSPGPTAPVAVAPPPVPAQPPPPAVAVESKPKIPAAKPVYTGPSSGTLVWSGQLDKDQEVIIDHGKASTGSVAGSLLPGVPVFISVDNARLAITQQPDPLNQHALVAFRSKDKGRFAIAIHWTVSGSY